MPTIDELIACAPEAGSVPFFDGSCWGYTTIEFQSPIMNGCRPYLWSIRPEGAEGDPDLEWGKAPEPLMQTTNDILSCMQWESLGLDSVSLAILAVWGFPTDIQLMNIFPTVDLTGTVLTIGTWTFDLSIRLKSSFYITDWNSNYQINNYWKVYVYGVDGVRVTLNAGTIDVWLCLPPPPYYTPGRCWIPPIFWIQAEFNWMVGAMTAPVHIVCDVLGAIYDVVITFQWTETIQDALDGLNLNPPQPAHYSHLSWNSSQVPGPGAVLGIVWWADQIDWYRDNCSSWGYMPNNKWLVLTWDDCDRVAKWIPPQCCLQEMSFTNGWIELTTWSRDNSTSYCGTGSAVHQGGGSCHCHGPEPLQSINTDNQVLSLTDDCPNEQLLCLTRRHGGTLGVQISDPDSCVDLIEVNSQTLNLQGNELYLLWSDLLVNSVVDLTMVNRHLLWLSWTELSIYDCMWNLNAMVDLEQVSLEILTISWWLMCVQKAIAPTNSCSTCVNQCIDLSRINFTCEDIENCVCSTLYDWHTVDDWTWHFIAEHLDDPIMDIARVNFFGTIANPILRSFCDVMYFFAMWFASMNVAITQIGEVIARQKYWAKITLTDNYVMWSQNTAYSGSHSDPRNQRWFIPAFDKSQGRHAQNSSMISTADYGAGGPFEHHNEISPDAGSLWTLAIADIAYSTNFWTNYDQTPSTNNPNANVDSHFCKDYARTITIVMDWFYHISLQWVLEADHNVQAFRYSCIRYNSSTGKLDLIIDSKFGWWSTVWSSSLNDPLVPRTNQYHGGWSKIKYLNAWDIIFPVVKISPQTIWPKNTTGLGVTDETDILYELNALTPKYWTFSHTSGTASGVGVTRSAGAASVVWNYLNTAWGPNVATNSFPWIPSNLPNVSPHYFARTWWLDWAEHYWRNLMYPGGYHAGARDDYRHDDWVVTLYGKASWFNSDGSGWTEGDSEWASLSVHRVQSKQRDEVNRTP